MKEFSHSDAWAEDFVRRMTFQDAYHLRSLIDIRWGKGGEYFSFRDLWMLVTNPIRWRIRRIKSALFIDFSDVEWYQ